MPKKDCLLGPIQIINKATGTAYKKFYIAHNSMTEGKPYDMFVHIGSLARIGAEKMSIGKDFHLINVLCEN